MSANSRAFDTGKVVLKDLSMPALRKIVAQSAAATRMVEEAAQSAQAYAQQIAPDDDPAGAGYVAGFQIIRDTTPSGMPHRRLINVSRDAQAIEYGSANRPQGGSNPPFHVLGRTLAQLKEGS